MFVPQRRLVCLYMVLRVVSGQILSVDKLFAIWQRVLYLKCNVGCSVLRWGIKRKFHGKFMSKTVHMNSENVLSSGFFHYFF